MVCLSAVLQSAAHCLHFTSQPHGPQLMTSHATMLSAKGSTCDAAGSTAAASCSANDPPYRILALYHFVKIPQNELPALKAEVETTLRMARARGTILLAPEGINGTISYPLPASDDGDGDDDGGEDDDHKLDKVLQYLQSHQYFCGLRTRTSLSNGGHVFHRLKIKQKNEIVTIGCDRPPVTAADCCACSSSSSVDPTEAVGTYIKPGKDWDDLLLDPDVVVIDTRNRYETEIGTFVNAVDPDTFSFTEFPDWMRQFAEGIKDERDGKRSSSELVSMPSIADESSNTHTKQERSAHLNRKPKAVAMFCTGGIRCEKSTSFVLSRKLFPEDVPIYHLEGGILAYLANVPEEESMWRGECFVFDQRVSVKHGLVPSEKYHACHGCRRPVSNFDRTGPDYVHGICCKHCRGDLTDRQLERFRERQRQQDLIDRGIVQKPLFHDPKEEP